MKKKFSPWIITHNPLQHLFFLVPSRLRRLVAGMTIIVVIGSFHQPLFAQQWYQQRGAQKNFYEMQSDFNAFARGKDINAKELGYKQYKRWEWYWQTRVMPDGSFPASGKNLKEFENYKIRRQNNIARDQQAADLLQSNAWQSIAQTSSGGGYDGTGRVNCVAFHPTDQNIFFAGTPGGGIWKTSNGGTSWTPLSDYIAQTGVTSIVVDYSNANIIYIGTGDGYGNLDVKGVGVLKSTNGGTTWQSTGLSWTTSQQYVVSAMVMSPASTSVLMAATSAGLYKTTDGGTTWTLVRSGRHQDVKYKPGDANTVYATSHNPANIYRSTDGGSTWSQVTSISGANRINIAVTPANTAVVGAIASRSSDNGFEGFYYSTNSGASFTKRSSTPNLLGWNANGGDTGGQGWYDLCVAISPTDANKILVGGVNTWLSTNGGTNWALNTHWSGASGVTTVHADKHFIAFSPLNSNTVIQCNDGGIYRSTNGSSTWSDITTGLAISMYYRISTAQTNNEIMIGGTQDNGGRKRSSTGSWSMATGGDGMDVAVDPTNFNMMYSSYPGGNVYRSNDQFVNNSVTISNNISSSLRSGWLSPYTLDPNNAAVIYLGYKDIFKTTNRGDSWTRISTNLSTANMSEVAVSKSSPGTVIVTSGTALFKTTNDGGAWSTITPAGLNGSRITGIVIHPTNSNIIWVTLGGYNAGLKVLKSTNGGTSWTNISGTLPNVPFNCIVYENNSSDALYIGGDVGVYFINASMSDWSLFNTSLPNCEVISLDIQYNSKKLRAGTWGRGVWQTDLYVDTPVGCNSPSALTASNITS
ncbi:MAG: WD40/YVTN/BNR-like repeat-containing protein, partial [Bacteroidota bacterium]